jgi:hypothetical protein
MTKDFLSLYKKLHSLEDISKYSLILSEVDILFSRDEFQENCACVR